MNIITIASIAGATAIAARVHKLVRKVLRLDVVLGVGATIVRLLAQPANEVAAQLLDVAVQEGLVVRSEAILRTWKM